jgi:penicillin-binding protein 1A
MSLNTVSVRLTLEVTPQAVVQTAHRLGIASKLEPNASIALGTSEVSPLELVGAYTPFANGGFAVIPHVIDRITAKDGKLLYTFPQAQLGRVIEPQYVAMMNAMMQQTLTIGTARKAQLPGWNAAGKTGTSQDFRDAWFVGYTPNLVTGVWLGNDDGTPTKHVTGGSLPVDIWSRVMRVAHQGVPVASLPTSYGNGFFSGLFGGGQTQPVSQAEEADGMAPRPPGSIQTSSNVPAARSGGMDGWLLDNLFGRR